MSLRGEDNLSIVDEMTGLNVSFIPLGGTVPLFDAQKSTSPLFDGHVPLFGTSLIFIMDFAGLDTYGTSLS